MLPTGHRGKTLILSNIFDIQLSATMSKDVQEKKCCSLENTNILLSYCSKDKKYVKKPHSLRKHLGLYFILILLFLNLLFIFNDLLLYFHLYDFLNKPKGKINL